MRSTLTTHTPQYKTIQYEYSLFCAEISITTNAITQQLLMCTHTTLVSAHICLVRAYLRQSYRIIYNCAIIGTESVLFSRGYSKSIVRTILAEQDGHKICDASGNPTQDPTICRNESVTTNPLNDRTICTIMSYFLKYLFLFN